MLAIRKGSRTHSTFETGDQISIPIFNLRLALRPHVGLTEKLLSGKGNICLSIANQFCVLALLTSAGRIMKFLRPELLMVSEVHVDIKVPFHPYLGKLAQPWDDGPLTLRSVYPIFMTAVVPCGSQPRSIPILRLLINPW